MGTANLFKYRPINANTERIFRNNEHWCSAPSTFNDIHECCMRCGPTDLSDVEVDIQRNVLRVCCFAGNHTDLLMWSHYAQQHRGLCIGFSVDEKTIYDPQNGNNSGVYYRVRYPEDDSIPVVTGGTQNDVLIQMFTAVSTKSRHWKYEQECRLIVKPAWEAVMKYSTAGITVPFPPRSLTDVYLGARISQEDQNSVIHWLLERKLPVRLYKAKRHPQKYELKFDVLGVVHSKDRKGIEKKGDA